MSYPPRHSHDGEILAFVSRYVEEQNRAPAIRTVADGIGLSRTPTYRQLEALVAAGKLERNGTRGYVPPGYKFRSAVVLPLLGNAACGYATEEDGGIEDEVDVMRYIFGDRPEEYFLLRAAGDSMVQAGIEEGDLLVIHRQTHAKNNDIVAVTLESGSMLKRYRVRGRNVTLHPENPAHKDLFFTRDEEGTAFLIQGVLRANLRR